MTHWLNNRLGRRWTVFLTCLISCASSTAQFFPNTWVQMFLARFTLGLFRPVPLQDCSFHLANNDLRLGDWTEECHCPYLGC